MIRGCRSRCLSLLPSALRTFAERADGMELDPRIGSMKKQLGLPLCAALLVAGATPVLAQAPRADLARWEAQAKGISIVRDDGGIAHVHGKTDADAVFG